MIERLGATFTDLFKKYMPDAFVFALLLTFGMAITAMVWMGSSPVDILKAWYAGFWEILSFGMQMVLLIITGYAIALSPLAERGINWLSMRIRSPKSVYLSIVLIGFMLSLVSWGWAVITAILARELASRVKEVNYPFLIACVYFSGISWTCGLSSSIPLLLNTEENYLISNGILSGTIATDLTLGSWLNAAMIGMLGIVGPVLMMLLRPKESAGKELKDLLSREPDQGELSISEASLQMSHSFPTPSDRLNNSRVIIGIIGAMGLSYSVYHFMTKGLDLNLNIMIFIFLTLGLMLHQTPMRYSIAMTRSSTNVSPILFQFPFYAGIMGIMTYTGIGAEIGQVIARHADGSSYALYAYALGGIVNFAIPSAGGEFAVIGPSVIEAVQQIGAGLPAEQMEAMIARASLSLAYGEGLTNLLQPFFLLVILPIMGAGIRIQSRDIMGYLVMPFCIICLLQILLVLYMP